MDKKEILDRKKELVLEMYELDSKLACCLKSFKRDEDGIYYEIKDDFYCDKCLSDTCFVLLEEGDIEEPNMMYA